MASPASLKPLAPFGYHFSTANSDKHQNHGTGTTRSGQHYTNRSKQKKTWRIRSFNQITRNGFFFRFLHLCSSPLTLGTILSLLLCSFSSSFYLFYYHWRDIVFTAFIFIARHSTNTLSSERLPKEHPQMPVGK